MTLELRKYASIHFATLPTFTILNGLSPRFMTNAWALAPESDQDDAQQNEDFQHIFFGFVRNGEVFPKAGCLRIRTGAALK